MAVPGYRSAELSGPVCDPLLRRRDGAGVAGRTFHPNQFRYPLQHLVEFAVEASDPAELTYIFLTCNGLRLNWSRFGVLHIRHFDVPYVASLPQ
jgi:hypothetical protein